MFTIQRCLKGQFMRLCLAGLGCLASLFLSLAVSVAHEGHDHGDADKSPVVSSAYPRVAARSELYEIVGILKDNQLSIFIDDAVTNAPISDAALQVTIGDSGAIEAEKAENGIFTVALPDRKLAGSVEVIFSVTAKSGDDLLVDSFTLPQATGATEKHDHGWLSPGRGAAAFALAGLGFALLFGYSRRRGHTVAATSAAVVAVALAMLAANSFGENRNSATDASPPATQALSDAPRRLQDGSAFAAKPTQRLLDIRTATAEPQTVRPALNLIGRVIADPNRSSIVQSIYGGRVIPSEGAIPRIGQRVSKGDILVQIDPYLPIADRTTILRKGRRDRTTDSDRRKQAATAATVGGTRRRTTRPGQRPRKRTGGLARAARNHAQFPHRKRRAARADRWHHHFRQGRAGSGHSASGRPVPDRRSEEPLGRGFGLWRDRSKRAWRGNGGRTRRTTDCAVLSRNAAVHCGSMRRSFISPFRSPPPSSISAST